MSGKPRLCPHEVLGISKCKECDRKYAKKYEIKNKEKREAYRRNPEVRRHRKKYMQNYVKRVDVVGKLKKYHKKYNAKYEKKLETKEYRKEWRVEHPKEFWASSTLSYHKRKEHKIEITKKQIYGFINNIENCTICGKELNFLPYKNHGKRTGPISNSPSLDRVDNEKIIKLNNIQILCYECNTTKGKRTMKEFIDYCKKVTLKYSKI